MVGSLSAVSFFLIPHRLLLGPRGQGSFEAPTEQLSTLPVAAQNL